MMSSINLLFNDFSKIRIVEVEKNMTKNTTQYQELITSILKIQSSIVELLPIEAKELLFKYEELEAQIQSLVSENIYEQGFKDGVTFYEFLHAKSYII